MAQCLTVAPLPNNPIKLPLFLGCAAVLIVVGITGSWVWLILAAGSLFCAAVVATGRNPRWLQSPLDRWAQERRERRGS